MEVVLRPGHRVLRAAEGFLRAGFTGFTDFEALADFTILTRTFRVFLDTTGLAPASAMAACAAASRAIATRNGEQLT